jgi:hypothetical protein
MVFAGEMVILGAVAGMLIFSLFLTMLTQAPPPDREDPIPVKVRK